MQPLADRYRILRQRGAGGLGQVWVAQDTRLNKQVAIKSLKQSDPATLARFQQEATATASLEHPNIVRVLDYFIENDAPYVVMEFLEGVSLAELVHAMGKLSADRAATLIAQVAAGLELAHGRGIIHRDIKPGNIQIVPHPSGGEQAKLLDFGIAKVLDAASLTASGMTMGTPGYMAPEQTLGGDVDPRTDLYALGVTLYYALTARLPYKGKTPQEILAQISTGSFEPLGSVRPDLDVGLTQIVERAMHRDIEARHAGASELRQELEAWLASRGVGGPLAATHAATDATRPVLSGVPTVANGPGALQSSGEHLQPTGSGSQVSGGVQISQAVGEPTRSAASAAPWLALVAVTLLGVLGLSGLAIYLLGDRIGIGDLSDPASPAGSNPAGAGPSGATSPPSGDDPPKSEATATNTDSTPPPKAAPQPAIESKKPQNASSKPPATATASQKPCRDGQLRCGNVCVWPKIASSHCGGCGRACKADEYCTNARCLKCDHWPYAICNGKCIYVSRDMKNCGGCGIQCRGQPCLNGKCGFPTVPKPK